jgi:hypothetical protein
MQILQGTLPHSGGHVVDREFGSAQGCPNSVVASIALTDISSIEATEFSEGKSVLLGFGLVIIATGGLILIGLSSNPPGH